MFKTYKMPHGVHKFSITKIISYDDNRDLEYYKNLYSLLKEDNDFGDIKVPKFDFEFTDTELIVKSQYIKGKQWQDDDLWHNSKLVFNNLVLKDGDYSFNDYNAHNFISESETDDLYYVDFEGYDCCTIEERSHSLQKELDKVLSRLDPSLRDFRIRYKSKLL